MLEEYTSEPSKRDAHVCYYIEAHRRVADGPLMQLGVIVKEVDQPVPLSITDQSEWFNPVDEELSHFAYHIKFTLPLSADHADLVTAAAEKYPLTASEIKSIVAGAGSVSPDGDCPFCGRWRGALTDDGMRKLQAEVHELRGNQEVITSQLGSSCRGCASNALIEPVVRALTIMLSVVHVQDPWLREEVENYFEELKRACDGFDRWGSDYSH
ncbi:hypothetical protein [Hyphomicrobium sp.]|uniref:hypothetical protein n=1 Tax=Hyphomicrobium sp. TaxID=82 RepID=UPI001D3A3682|nr:hypothetical protein [Hyphomicrobium sp.]MBY0558806.1 hypothetical protein [Hyphomicrobium sp.]